MSRLLLRFALASGVLAAQDSDLATRAVKVLEQRCQMCHGPSLAQSGLNLHSRELALKGGTRGPSIVAGNAAQSTLVQAVKRTGALAMPPGPKLADAEIATLEQWVAAGAAWPKIAVSNNLGAAAAQTWWSFRKPVRAAVPTVKDAAWVRMPVDAFILKKHNEEKLAPAHEASRAALVRFIATGKAARLTS